MYDINNDNKYTKSAKVYCEIHLKYTPTDSKGVKSTLFIQTRSTRLSKLCKPHLGLFAETVSILRLMRASASL